MKMDKISIRKQLINALANGDIKALRKIKAKLNPVIQEIDQFYAVYADGEYTGEAYEMDGTPLEVVFVEQPEYEFNEEDGPPKIGMIIITVSNKNAMLECIEQCKIIRGNF